MLLLLAACKSKTPVPDMIKIMDRTTEKIEKTTDMAELDKITSTMASEMSELKDKYPDYQPTDEEKSQIMEASVRMATASAAAYQKAIQTPEE